MNTSVSSILFSCFKSNQLEMCSPDYSLESPLTYKANKNHYLQWMFPICQPIMHHFLTLTSLQQFSLCCSLETERSKREGKHTAVFSHTFCHRLHHKNAIKKVSYGALFSPLPSLSSEQQKPLNKLINSYPTNPGYNPYRLKVLHSRTEQAQGWFTSLYNPHVQGPSEYICAWNSGTTHRLRLG